MKRVYHIVFKEKPTDYMSKGKNYTNYDATLAYTEFLREYENPVFIAMYDLNALADIKGTSTIKVPQDIPENSSYDPGF